MATKAAPKIVRAKDSFTTQFRTVRKGELLPADDPIVLAKPKFFVAHEATR